MKMKRMLCLFLALTMVLSTMPYSAFAAETGSHDEMVSYEAQWTNPVYDSAVQAPEAGETTYSLCTADYYTTVEEAGAYLREQMVNRATTVEFRFTPENFSAETFDAIYAEALKHTGVPTEGDSLNFVCGGWTSRAYGVVGEPLTLQYNITYYTDAEQEAVLTSAVNDLKAKLNLDGKSDYQIIKGIYDYMTANIQYDYANLGNTAYKLQYTGYAALINKTSVCQGYATLFYRLAMSYGIDTRIISGQSHGENHAWNIVKLGDKYYYLDSTWDSTWDADKTNHTYFLKGSANFGEHTLNSEYTTSEFVSAYPMDTDDYVVRDSDLNGGGEQPGDEPDQPVSPHVCSPTLTGKVEATCAKTGKQAYYRCSCGRYYEDAAATKLISDISSWGIIGVKDHDWSLATCTVPKTCKVCKVTEGTTKPHTEELIPGKAATLEAAGLTAGKKCSVCGTVTVTQETIAAIDTVKLSYTKKAYTGKTLTAPELTVTDTAGKTLVSGTDYTVTGLTGKKSVGRYKVTVTFKGSYAGSRELYFNIVPKKTTSAKAVLYGYDDIKFSWSKVTGASGYLVYYKKGSGSWSKAVATTGTSYKKANLSDGVKYTFKVVPYYKEKNGTTKYYDANQYKTAYTYTLKKVSGVKVAKSGTKVKVSWSNISGETGYQISKMTSKKATQKKPLTVKSGTAKSKLITATKGKTYYYKVRAYKEVSGKKIYGPWSAVKAYKRR